MTDDYDFRASERRRARELDELEARRLRARERQRAQLRAAHRRRRLTVLAVLGLVIGVASGAWVWTSGTPEGAPPGRARPKTSRRPPSRVARTMPAFTRGVHVSAPWAEHPRQSRPGARHARPQPDPDRRQGRERRGLGPRGAHARARQALRRRRATTTTSRTSCGSRTTATSGSSRASSASRTRSSPSRQGASRSTTPQGGIWHDGGGVPWLNQYSPGAWNVPDQPRQGGRARRASTRCSSTTCASRARATSSTDALAAQGQASP